MTAPLGDNTLVRRMEFPGRPALPDMERIVLRNVVSPGFFATLGTPFISGRDFDERDEDRRCANRHREPGVRRRSISPARIRSAG